MNVENDSSRAQWIVEGCAKASKDTLEGIVPAVFEDHVRICQPGWLAKMDDNGQVDYANKRPVRWDDIAIANDCTPHPRMMWCGPREVSWHNASPAN